MFSYLSYVAIGIAAVLSFYQILSRREPSSQYKYKTRTASFYSIVVMVLPFVLGGLMLYDGYTGTMSIIQVLFVWMLTLSFWQTMLFVPLAIRSVTRESQLKDPLTWPRISVIIPAYNEEKVIETTIKSLLSTDYPDKEIIVVDDGSKDDTLTIASQFKDQIKVIHKRKWWQGVCAKSRIVVCNWRHSDHSWCWYNNWSLFAKTYCKIHGWRKCGSGCGKHQNP